MSKKRKPVKRFVAPIVQRGKRQFDVPVTTWFAGPSEAELAAFRTVFAACQRAAGVEAANSGLDSQKPPELTTPGASTDRTSFTETHDGRFGDSLT